MNTRFTAESATHIATFTVTPYDQDACDIGATSTFTMPAGTKGCLLADHETCQQKQKELTSALGFGIQYSATFRDNGDHVFYFTATIGNREAVIMSLAEKS